MKEQNQLRYPDEIIQDAQEYGYKAANLQFLVRNLTKDKLPSSDVELKIPVLKPIANKIIIDHLNNYAPSWQGLWQSFVNAYNEQSDRKILSEEAETFLKELQVIMQQCFSKNLLPEEYLTELKERINPDDLLMVRSSGKEDNTEFANPGGNESKDSVKFTQEEISRSIGYVIASYVSKKSLSQRIKVADDITQDPFLPVLIQKMIGEDICKQSVHVSKEIVRSGVIYTNNGCTRTQSAYGHGEIVVNSTGNFDNYYVTTENVVYSEIKVKHFRLAPHYNADKNVNELVTVDNDSEARCSSSLSEDIVIYLHKLACYIEKLYGMRMDIEFVYAPSQNTVYLVQARPIPLGARKELQPSALAVDFIAQAKDLGCTIINGQIITPEVNRAVVITHNKESIISTTIEDALSLHYNNNMVKAVVVNHDAPDTSHAAGEFSAHAIPVIYIEDLDKAENLAATLDGQNAIIIDSQRKKIVGLPTSNPTLGLDLKDLESSLYRQKILQEGIFKSPLSNYVTPAKYNFVDVKNEPLAIGWTEIQHEKLGQILEDARKGNQAATEKLFSYLFNIINQDTNSKPITSYKELLAALEQLDTPKFGEANDNCIAALRNMMRFAARLRQNNLLSQPLFVKIILTAGELYLMVKNLESQVYTQQTFLEYINVLEKFSGLFISTEKKDTISESLILGLTHKQHELNVSKILNIDDVLDEEQKSYFYEISKLASSLLDCENRIHWYNFCREICKERTQAIALSNMVAKLVQQDLHPLWINTFFLPVFLKCNNDYQATFQELQENFKEVTPHIYKLKQAAYILNSLENQIASWKEPAKFNKLYEPFTIALDQLREHLKFDEEIPELIRLLILKYVNQWVDIFDRTIKSLEKSTLYAEDTVLQVERFRVLVKLFFQMMQEWSELAPYDLDCCRASKIDSMQAFLDSKESSNDRAELSPSASFAVNSATIGSPGGRRGFFYNFEEKKKSLEDLFSLIHQNLLEAISRLVQKNSEGLIKACPPFLVKLYRKISSKKAKLAVSPTVQPITQFINAEIKYPEVILNYNVPLRSHSGRIKVIFDYINRAATVEVAMFGHDVKGRWHIAGLVSYIYALMERLKVLQVPKYNENNQTLEYKVMLGQESQIPELISNIVIPAKLSFMYDSGCGELYNREIKKLKRRLSKINDENLNQLISNVIKYIKDLDLFRVDQLKILKLLIMLYPSQSLITDNLMHNDFIESISLLMKNCSQTKSEFLQLNSLYRAICDIKKPNSLSTVKCTNIAIWPPNILLNYRIPDFGIIRVIYNYLENTAPTELEIEMFGRNDNNNWYGACLLIYSHALGQGLKVSQVPKYDAVNEIFSYKLTLNNNLQVSELISNITMAINLNFLQKDYALYNTELVKAATCLLSANDENFKLLTSAIIKYINEFNFIENDWNRLIVISLLEILYSARSDIKKGTLQLSSLDFEALLIKKSVKKLQEKQNLDEQTLKRILSDNIMRLLNKSKFSLKALISLDKVTAMALMSPIMLQRYELNDISINDYLSQVNNVPLFTIKLKILRTVINYYIDIELSITKEELDKLLMLFTLKLYSSDLVLPLQFEGLSMEKIVNVGDDSAEPLHLGKIIKMIIAANIIASCDQEFFEQDGLVKLMDKIGIDNTLSLFKIVRSTKGFDLLKDIGYEKVAELNMAIINVIFSKDVLRLYKYKIMTPDLLVNFIQEAGNKKFFAFINPILRSPIKPRLSSNGKEGDMTTYEDLLKIAKNYDVNYINIIIKIILSNSAFEVYQRIGVTSAQLLPLIEKNKAKVKELFGDYYGVDAYCQTLQIDLLSLFSYVGSTDIKKLKIVLNPEVIYLYKENKLDFENIMAIDDVQRLSILLSPKAIEGYCNGFFSLKELSGLNNAQINTVFQLSNPRIPIENGDLKYIDDTIINTITNDNSILEKCINHSLIIPRLVHLKPQQFTTILSSSEILKLCNMKIGQNFSAKNILVIYDLSCQINNNIFLDLQDPQQAKSAENIRRNLCEVFNSLKFKDNVISNIFTDKQIKELSGFYKESSNVIDDYYSYNSNQLRRNWKLRAEYNEIFNKLQNCIVQSYNAPLI